jgi:hypothetical protein
MKLLTSYKKIVAAFLFAMCFTFNASGVGNTGACCFDAFKCYDDIPLSDCVEFSGTYMGDGSSCNSDGTCYNAGACCIDAFQCLVMLEQECVLSNGTYMGDGSFCNADGSCYNAGACCIDDNGASQCAITLLNECIDSGGSYAGDGTVCLPDWSCPEDYNSGACCINNACLNMTLMRCEEFSGIYHGSSSFCGDIDIECIETCNADLNSNGEVDIDDLLLLIGAWGACP